MPADAKSLVQHQFGAHADGYVTSPTHAAGYSLDRLVERVNPGPGQRVLDLATGGGHTALALARRGARTVAGDITLPMLRAARDHIAAQLPGSTACYARLDAERLPFPAGTFDAVTCRIAPHHFPNVAQFMRECARVVRPGGTVGVVDQLSSGDPHTARYVNAFERLRDPSHVWAYNEDEWKGFFTGAGLAILHYEPFDIQQELIDWAERMGCDAPTVTRARAMLVQAPAPVATWMRPHVFPSGEAHFVIHQFLLVGRKSVT
jgi:SAM-dependent methyltransferase